MGSGEGIHRQFFLEPVRLMRSLPDAGFEPLIGADAWNHMATLAEQFNIPVQTVCFECRLRSNDARVDLAFCLFPGAEIANLVEDLERAGRTQGMWARFVAFMRAWISPETGLANRIPFVCPAFDMTSATSMLPEPCVSLCVDPDFFVKRLGFVPDTSPSERSLVDLLGECSTLLTGRPPRSSVLERLLASLRVDPTVRAKHVSFMLPRPATPTKLDLVLPVGRLGAFLERIGWPESPRAIETAARELVPWDGDIQLNLTLHPEAPGPLEIEVFAGASAAVSHERLPFLDRLVRCGLADPNKASVLREAWQRPTSLAADGRVLARSWYVKARFSGSIPEDAKVYLGLMPRPPRTQARE